MIAFQGLMLLTASDSFMNSVRFLTGNRALNVSIFGFVIAQTIKVLTVLIRYKRFDAERIFGSGGMPSSHAACVSALAASLGKTYGLASPYFAIAVVLAIIVMYDASHIRKEAGNQAKIINTMMMNWHDNKVDEFGKELKELLGHTIFEVLIGCLLGIALGLLL